MEIKNQLNKIKKESEEIKTEARQRMVEYILAAFGLVAGLAWNEAIKSLIEYVFPLSRSTLLLKFFYAFLITIILVLISSYLMNLLKIKNKK